MARRRRTVAVAVAVAGLLLQAAACAHRGAVEMAATPDEGWRERGLASWYGHPYHGRQTASGETYDMHELTAAHRTLPFGTVVRVERRDTAAAVEVRINDRGPFIRGRVIDLSYAAARAIGLDVDGVAPVEVVVIVGALRPRVEPPTTGAPSPPTGCVWVQVGAFGDDANARRVVQRLRRDGHEAVVVEGPGGLQRVRVGPFEARADAAAALRQIHRRYPEARLVECGG